MCEDRGFLPVPSVALAGAHTCGLNAFSSDHLHLVQSQQDSCSGAEAGVQTLVLVVSPSTSRLALLRLSPSQTRILTLLPASLVWWGKPKF